MTNTIEPEPGLSASEELDFRDLLDVFPAAVYTTDAAGLVTFYNKAAEQLAGRTPEVGVDRWCVSWRLYRTDGTPLPLDQCPMAVTLRDGRAVRNVEVVAERPDGVRVPLMPFPTPLRDAAGRLTGAVNMLVDISALKRAETAAATRADEQAALYRFTDRLYRAEAIDEVYEASLDAILAALHCNRASVLLFDDAGAMQFVAARGLSERYCKAVAGHTPWTPGQSGPQPITVGDIETSDMPDELKAAIRGEGIGALAFIPLEANGGVIGKFMAYHDAPHDFDDHEIELALTVARQLGFAIERSRAAAQLARSDARYRAVVECQTEMLCRFRSDGTILFVNGAYARANGTTPEELTGAHFWKFIPESDHAHVAALLQRLTPDSPEVRIENRVLTTEGERWMLWTNRALAFDASGRWSEAQSTGIDITERKRAEQALRESEERFRAIVDTTPECVKLVAADGSLLHMNASGLSMLGADRFADVDGVNIYDIIAPEHREVFKAFNEKVCAGERGSLAFDIIGLDGVRRHMETHAAPFRNPGGDTVQLAVSHDVSERRRAEEQRTLLINELNHRVKNTLATVQSLAMQTLRSTERSAEARALFDSRLMALARAHDLLTAQSWESAKLREVLALALAPFRGDERRVELIGPEVRVPPKQALALSLAMHELATNAAKYGALSNESGTIELIWSVDDSAKDGADLQLIWTEKGGPPVTPPQRAGFGTRLIQDGLSRELGGSARISYRPDGVVAVIISPVAAAGVG